MGILVMSHKAVNLRVHSHKYFLLFEGKRIGAIPYCIHEGKIMVLMGFNTRYSLSDFGGGIKKNEQPLKALSREIREETSKGLMIDIMGSIETNTGCTVVLSAPSIRNRIGVKSILLLVYLPYEIYTFTSNSDIMGMVWLPLDGVLGLDDYMFSDSIRRCLAALRELEK